MDNSHGKRGPNARECGVSVAGGSLPSKPARNWSASLAAARAPSRTPRAGVLAAREQLAQHYNWKHRAEADCAPYDVGHLAYRSIHVVESRAAARRGGNDRLGLAVIHQPALLKRPARNHIHVVQKGEIEDTADRTSKRGSRREPVLSGSSTAVATARGNNPRGGRT